MTKLQIVKYVGILVMGAAISLYLFYSINEKYVVRNKGNLDNATSKANLKIIEQISKIDLVIESMAFFFENTPEVTPRQFKRFTDPFTEELRGIKALGWGPKISNFTKQQYLDATEENFNDFIDIKETDSTNNLITSEVKKTYYPMTLINPLDIHREILGYDMYSDSIRKSAIENTISAKKISFTAPIELVEQSGGGTGFLAMKSVFYRNSDDVKGVVLGVYRMQEFIEETLVTELKMLDIEIYDKMAANVLMYSNRENKDFRNLQEEVEPVEIKAGNRIWIVYFISKPQFDSYPHVVESYIALFLTFIATFLLIAMIRRRDYYYNTLENKVRLRTLELEESNKLKENLLREIHHRVKNNLQITSSMMNMQKRKLTSQEAITAIEDSQARISAIALTHQKIYQDKDSKAVNLCEYLTDLMKYQERISPDIHYNINCPDLSIDLDRAVPLALIISELVTNALKHAYTDSSTSNELDIMVKTLDEDQILLVIKDNGKGLPENFNIKKADGIGFEIIRALCRQISADFTYTSDATGTSFTISFRNEVKAQNFN